MIATINMVLALDGAAEPPDPLESSDPITEILRISLLCDRRAEQDDPHDGDLKGWWADILDEDGRKSGSRLWLLDRSRLSTATLTEAEDYAREALAWLVEDRIATAVEVEAVRLDLNRMGLRVQVVRDESQPGLRHAFLWDGHR